MAMSTVDIHNLGECFEGQLIYWNSGTSSYSSGQGDGKKDKEGSLPSPLSHNTLGPGPAKDIGTC